MNNETKRQIVEAMDSFLTEAKDQDGNERSLERLNKDRELFIKRMEEIYKEKHICCDGECNHDDCCGKISENCPNYKK